MPCTYCSDPHRQLCVVSYAVHLLCCTYQSYMPVDLLSDNHGNAWNVPEPDILLVGGLAGGFGRWLEHRKFKTMLSHSNQIKSNVICHIHMVSRC